MPKVTREPIFKSNKSEEAPQDPIDKRGPDYDNNHPMDWVRGKNEDATKMPHFDNGPKWFNTKGK
jgi:hypothetical protein